MRWLTILQGPKNTFVLYGGVVALLHRWEPDPQISYSDGSFEVRFEIRQQDQPPRWWASIAGWSRENGCHLDLPLWLIFALAALPTLRIFYVDRRRSLQRRPEPKEEPEDPLLPRPSGFRRALKWLGAACCSMCLCIWGVSIWKHVFFRTPSEAIVLVYGSVSWTHFSWVRFFEGQVAAGDYMAMLHVQGPQEEIRWWQFDWRTYGVGDFTLVFPAWFPFVLVATPTA